MIYAWKIDVFPVGGKAKASTERNLWHEAPDWNSVLDSRALYSKLSILPSLALALSSVDSTVNLFLAAWSITTSNQGAGSSDVKLVTVFAPSPAERNGSYNLYFAG